MAASTAIMHSSSGLGSASVAVAPSALTSSSASSSSGSTSSPPSENRSSSDEEEVLTSSKHSDCQSEGKGEEEEEEGHLMVMTDDEEEQAAKDRPVSTSQSKGATASEDADDNSTIVGDNEDEEEQEDSQMEIDVEDKVAEDKCAEEGTVNSNSNSNHTAGGVAFPGSQIASTFSSAFASAQKKLSSTGKLERITAALAKRQSNGNVPNLFDAMATFRDTLSPLSAASNVINSTSTEGGSSSVAPPESSATTVSEDELIDEDDEDDDEGDEEEEEVVCDDEEDDEDEEMRGFRALGLMGNVAFMGEEKFKCPVCGLQLDSQHTFTLHIRSHNPNDHSNTCRLCGKTLSSASSLDRHMLIHSGERPFKCSICNMAFTTNGNMHRHMRTHGHGTIGYTPRGAKRRAKLFAQQAAKVAAAAAAGEPLDAATLSKLKKSALEVTTGNGKSPISGTPMKKQRGSGGRKSNGGGGDSFGSLEATLNGNVQSNSVATLLEAEQIAAAAAAYAASVASGGSEGGSGGKGGLKKNAHHANTQHQQQHSGGSVNSPFAFPSASHLGPSPTSAHQHHPHHLQQHHASSPSVPLNLASAWPGADFSLLGSTLPQATTPILPAKGKPGRKKKPRLAEAEQASNGAAPGSGGATFPSGAFSNLNAPALCPLCACRVGSKMELHVHMASYHASEKLFCLDCGMILDNYTIYTQHHCTVTAAAVVNALKANPQANPELLFRSTNTSRMNFSSARFPGMLPGGNASGHHPAPQQPTQHQSHHHPLNGVSPQDHLGSLMSQLTKSFGAQAAAAASHSFFASQHPTATPPPPSAPSSKSRSSPAVHHQPIVDLNLAPKSGSGKSSVGQSCGQCDRKFPNTKQLKAHIDTFCHECSLNCGDPSTYFAHQFSHNIDKFPHLSKALGTGKTSEGFSNAMAAALPQLLGVQTSGLVNQINQGPSLQSPTSLAFMKTTARHSTTSYPKMNSSPAVSSLDLSLSSGQSSLNSLTSTMADMKPDLADIQSIISMAKHTKLPLSASNSSALASTYKSVPSLSPNRASDAGIDSKKSARHGDATSHPDSPASADSAAAAVASAASRAQGSQLATSSRAVVKTEETGHEHLNEDLHETAKTNGHSSPVASEEHLDADDADYLEVDDEEEPESLPPSKRRRSLSESPTKESSGKSENGDALSASPSGGGAQRFRCEQCRLSFKSMNAFRRHNRGHTAGGGHSHACHLCPYKSLDKSTLIRHLRTHNGERPFQCAICKYAFTTKANCERHVRKRHRNLKSKAEIRNAMQYNRDMAATAAATKMVSQKIFIERDEPPTSQDTVCKECGVDFDTNRELRAHLRVPNNPCSQQLKPYVCTICKIGFNTHNNCVRHIIKQHPATIECNGEEAAKLISTAVGHGTGSDGSLNIETGSSASLSPSGGSAGQMSGHSAFSDRSFGSSDQGLSECESFGTGSEGEMVKPGGATSLSPLISPSSNASFAALCQVAASVEKRAPSGTHGRSLKSPGVEVKSKSRQETTEASNVLNLSVKGETEADVNVLDLSRPKRVSLPLTPSLNGDGGLDLSLKSSNHAAALLPKVNGSMKMEWPEESNGLLLGRNSLLSKLYQNEQAEQQQQQQAAAAAMAMAAAAAHNQQQQQQHPLGFDMNAMAAVAAFGKFGVTPGAQSSITNETLANLMAQFHQHQAAQFAAMKATASIAKNH